MPVLAGQWGPEGIEYPNGQHAVNTPFRVTTDTGFLVPLFEDETRTVPLPNPGRTDQYGNLYFFANPGTYDLTINDSFTIPITVKLHPDEPIGAGGGGASGFEFAVNQPVTLVQVAHGLSYKPGGIIVIDSLGDPTEYDGVSHPAPGVTEITFGSSFGPGIIYLS